MTDEGWAAAPFAGCNIVARRRVNEPWPVIGEQAKAIKKMRDDFEAGKVIMCQKKTGPFVYQYAINRKQRGPAQQGYFINEER